MAEPLFLIRTDKLEYLNDLQNGNLFMQTCVHYQCLESEDIARKDAYDGSIMTSNQHFNVIPPMEVGAIRNARFTEANCFIKSFHQYSADSVKRLPNHILAFEFSAETKKSMRSFGNEYAMILPGPEFINRFKAACKARGYKCGAGSVCYMTSEQYAESETAIVQWLMSKQHDKCFALPQISPALCKPERFSAQQEYRIYLQYESREYQQLILKAQQTSATMQEFLDVIHQPLVFNMGSLEDISLIVPIDIILNNPIYLHILDDGKVEIEVVH